MKTKYHCSCHWDSRALHKLLEAENIKCSDFENFFVFDFYSDHPKAQLILQLTRQDSRPMIIEMAIFSKEEMDRAEWFSMEATRQIVDTRNWEYTFAFECEFDLNSSKRYGHITQVNPFLSSPMPKWKNKFNFCSTAYGDFSTIFCSDYARKCLEESDVVGIDYLPVLKGDLKTSKENLHQLIFPNIFPTDALEAIGEHTVEPCPVCGKTKYIFKKPMVDNLRVKKEKIPKGVDAFISDIGISRGDMKVVVVSKKVYQIIIETMQEKHMRFYPLG